MQDLNQLLKTLLSNNLDFLIIGGFASVVHGSSHKPSFFEEPKSVLKFHKNSKF